jgi:hypothetical protein
VTGGTIDVNFSDQIMDVSVSTQNETYTNQLTSQQISDFYSGGLPLLGQNNSSSNGGSISGAFVGSNAEGIISNLQLCEGCDAPAAGTAVFQR